MGTSPSPSPSVLERFRRAWKRVFFWQNHLPLRSQEHVPQITADQRLVANVTASAPLPAWRQMRYLSHVFSKKERFQFWGSLLAGACFSLVSFGFFAEPRLAREPAQGGLLIEGVVGSPKWINPVLAPLNDVDRDLNQLLFSGLFRFERLAVMPDLAASVETLDQGKTLEIRLREDASFHDGEPVTADDVAFTINDAIKNPVWHSPLAGSFRQIEAIRIDERTVQIKNADPTLSRTRLEELLTVGILPAHRWEETADGMPQLAEANLKPIGSGPYQLDTFTRDSRGAILTYTLKRFPQYYGTAPLLDQRQFRFYGDRKSGEAALASNQVDALAFVPWSDAAGIPTTDSKTLELEPPQVTTVFFNTQDAILKDPNVRNALQLAVDRSELAQQFPHVTPLQTPFPFFESYATSTQLPDLEAARRLLEDQRWKLDEATGQRFLQPAPPSRTMRATPSASSTAPTVATSTPLALTILVPSQGDLPLVAEHLKRRWSLLGADVTIQSASREEIVRQALEQRTHQVVLLNVLAQQDGDLLPFWQKTDGNLNFSQLNLPALLTDFQSLNQATSSEAVVRARTAVTERILNQRAALFLFRPSYAYFVPNSLQGTHDLQIRTPAERLSETSGWYLKTKLRWQN